MTIAVLIYVALGALIFWSYCGYLISLLVLSAFEPKGDRAEEVLRFPTFVLLVPCYNEEALVGAKFRNLAELDYPKDRMRILFLDGGSVDATRQLINDRIAGHPHMELVETGTRGKTPQINAVLPSLTAEIVVCTDMDAELSRNVLRDFARAFEADGTIGVVGAKVIPRTNSLLETQYWEDQNVIRLLESEVHSSSIVIAPCYAFRRGLIDAFPEDCVADDIFISFLANVKGFKVKYLPGTEVYETRTPYTLPHLISHKFRKGNAYMREVLRFLRWVSRMPRRWKLIYITKVLQVVVMPWVLIVFGIATVALSLGRRSRPRVVGLVFVFLLVSLAATSLLMARKRRQMVNRNHRRSLMAVFLLTNFILFLNALTYPFYRQTSRFEKIAPRGGPDGRHP
jgi:cellulose synthase/poly-beta-1,6-N-acetylglucosamine synthase-like glycosyltransferase